MDIKDGRQLECPCLNFASSVEPLLTLSCTLRRSQDTHSTLLAHLLYFTKIHNLPSLSPVPHCYFLTERALSTDPSPSQMLNTIPGKVCQVLKYKLNTLLGAFQKGPVWSNKRDTIYTPKTTSEKYRVGNNYTLN